MNLTTRKAAQFILETKFTNIQEIVGNLFNE